MAVFDRPKTIVQKGGKGRNRGATANIMALTLQSLTVEHVDGKIVVSVPVTAAADAVDELIPLTRKALSALEIEFATAAAAAQTGERLRFVAIAIFDAGAVATVGRRRAGRRRPERA